ncbi:MULTISPECIES: ABC transporter substrate binding protein [Dethiosulfovibrio]|uniref:histidine kinase n=2 Tax=Dethiosulfovibrio TaxID=47054 RepID=A0ABS9EN10_9BACT|nr:MULTISPECIES: ABC transporter substrate binding protein [Dethiosulfovibrio]MCF4114265.1 response regulator [Dethiosulfovibrio russensis]MCF4142545.1 response regulator [Dethiosulfovibrio marinus]MCF4145590.1 response regulator [Dethiosulfovibrio acidaminovorans]
MISSYHPGFTTFFPQVEGVKSVLDPERIALDVEFMDTKRFDDEENLARFRSLIEAKLDQLPRYDAVLTADDAALRFALEHGKKLFPDTPMVFCGVNDIDLASRQNSDPLVTGVVEDVSMRGTLELIKLLQPEVKEIVAISDGTVSGVADARKFRSIGFALEGVEFSLISLKDLSWKEARERLKSFDDEAAALLLSAYLDYEGISKSFEEGLEYLTDGLNIPVYHLWAHGIGKGLLGGRIISQKEQGRNAAKMVVQILKGTSPKDIPVLTESPNSYLFDHAQLERFDIPSYRLPEDSIVIGKPVPFYECEPIVFWAILGFAGLLTPISLLTTYLFLKGKKDSLALRESEKRYRSLIKNASEGILVTALPDREILYANPAMTEMLGYPYMGIRGKNESEIHPDRSAGVDPHGKPGKAEIDFMRSDGSVFVAEENWTKIAVDGKPALLGFVTDVTERRRIDEELRKHREELERTVKERTAELEQAKVDALSLAARAQEENRKANETLEKLARSEKMIIDAKDAADEANRAKSDFLATMSHEIRTPLNAIIGLSQLLLREDLSERHRDRIAKIDSSGKTLLAIIDDILDFSKIEADKLEIERIPFSLERIVSETVDAFSLEAERKRVELHMEISPDLPSSVLGDPFRIRQILNNLISNAIKFTEEGDIIVSLRQGSRYEDKMELIFSVSDTGIGMTDEQLKRIFDPFIQADSSTTRKYRGTGLGLSISHKLCKLMGGNIRAESRLGEGSAFTFSITVGIMDGENRTIYRPQDKTLSALTNLRILVVDDNPIARKILREMLRSMAFDVETVSSGEDAIARLKASEEEGLSFDIVIMDWKMPRMDGIETAIKISESGLNESPRLLMVTGHRRAEILEKARSSGFIDVLSKPVQPSSLLDSIMESISKGHPDKTYGNDAGPTDFIEEKLRGAKILVVEDNDLNLEVATGILQQAGAMVIPAKNGRKAVESFSKDHLDLILMDVQMPEMDGFEATEIIREKESEEKKRKRTPIVAMTAHAMSGDRERCIEAGMDDYVTKPIDRDILIDTSCRWIFGKSFKGRDYPTAPADEKIPEKLRIKGIDPEMGIYRTGSDLEGYVRFLRKFVEQFHDTASDVAKAIDADDDGRAAWELHSLKGTAGNLGLIELQEISELLESAVRKDRENIPPVLEAFEKVHRRTLEDLQKAIPSETEEGKKRNDRNASTDGASRIEDLKSLLDRRQPQPALSILEETVWPEEIKEEIERISSAVKRYRFEDAIPIAERLSKKLEAISEGGLP